MVMSLLQEAARSNGTNRLPQDVFKSMAARLSGENVTEGGCVVKAVQRGFGGRRLLFHGGSRCV